MSLLLEALKKAELAKQAAKEQQPASAEPPLTRDKLPDISQPMEIRSEDLSLAEPAPAPKPAEKPVLELALEEAPRAAPPPPPPPPPRAAPMEEPEFIAPSESMERKQAQQLFEAKELDVNPRKPFYITLGALGLLAGWYGWSRHGTRWSERSLVEDALKHLYDCEYRRHAASVRAPAPRCGSMAARERNRIEMSATLQSDRQPYPLHEGWTKI